MAVSGLFYPQNAPDLDRTLDGLLKGAPLDAPVPKAVIVPHAGYIYSGAVAAQAYRALAPAAGTLRRVLLFGPSHREWFRGLAVPCVSAFATPLGPVTVDRAALAQLSGLASVVASDSPHTREHSLEVQLPFLRRVLPAASIVPVLIGEASAAAVETVMNTLWGGPETVIIVSSDLSHYHRYEEARQLDQATATAILDGRADLDGDEACGCVAVNGLLRAARRHGLRARLFDLRNSGDTAGTRDRVVGYGAFGFYAD